MLTTIQIAGLQTFGYHGLFKEERSLGQKFTFDIDATLNPAPTHRDDRLDASIRYDAVVDAAVSLAGANEISNAGSTRGGHRNRPAATLRIDRHHLRGRLQVQPPNPAYAQQSRDRGAPCALRSGRLAG